MGQKQIYQFQLVDNSPSPRAMPTRYSLRCCNTFAAANRTRPSIHQVSLLVGDISERTDSSNSLDAKYFRDTKLAIKNHTSTCF